MEKKQKPKFATKDMLIYLDDLRDSGLINMFGAAEYLRKEYPKLSKQQSYEVLSYWMHTYKGDK